MAGVKGIPGLSFLQEFAVSTTQILQVRGGDSYTLHTLDIVVTL